MGLPQIGAKLIGNLLFFNQRPISMSYICYVLIYLLSLQILIATCVHIVSGWIVQQSRL